MESEVSLQSSQGPTPDPVLGQLIAVDNLTPCFKNIVSVLSSHLLLGTTSDPFVSDFPTGIMHFLLTKCRLHVQPIPS